MHKLEDLLMEHFIEFVIAMSVACIGLVAFGLFMS